MISDRVNDNNNNLCLL